MTRQEFDLLPTTGHTVAGRPVHIDSDGSDGVWWCDCFGICSPLVADLGGPLGHRVDSWPFKQFCGGDAA